MRNNMLEFPPPASNQKRAIIIGGNISGLLASRVLVNHFDEVIILERDKFPKYPDFRPGVSQGKHVHLVLARANQILEQFFPGINQQLKEYGAEMVKMGEELAVLTYYGWRIQHSRGLQLLTFTQPLLEWCIRNRLTGISAIKMIAGCRVTGLISDHNRYTVRGVRCRFMNDLNDKQNLFGELVIDATGRFSRMPEWLKDIGYKPPKETIIDPFLGYASRLYEMSDMQFLSDSFRRNWKALLLTGKPPDTPFGGVLLPVEGKRWHITLVGIGKNYPSNDETNFLQFARSLRSRIIYDIIKKARPLSPITGYRAMNNQRRYYEKMIRWPDGLIIIGDALCAFNPVYAQGITVAAMEVMMLDQYLDHNPENKKNTIRTMKLQRKLAKVIEIPWLMATIEDSRWPMTKNRLSGPINYLISHYMDSVIALATKYPEIDHRFAQVAHFMKPAYMLFHPKIVFSVLNSLLLKR